MRIHKFSPFLVLGVITLFGCASAPVSQDIILAWPSPPEEPRIAYVKSHYGEADFRKLGFFDTIFGAPPARVLRQPYGVFAYRDKIYVTQQAERNVAIIDIKERKVRYIGERGMGRLGLPVGVAVASDGAVFVSDAERRVLRYDSNGDFKGVIGKKDDFITPTGIAINNELGRLYVVDARAHTVHVYSLSGEKLFQFGGAGHRDGEFFYPTNVAIDRRNGNVVVVDTQNFRVQVFDKDGKFIRKFGEVGDIPGLFSRPKGVGVDSEGHIYVTDSAFDNFQIFDETGQILLFVGSTGNYPGYFQLPAGMYVDEKDRIYVVDPLNSRVQVFQYMSEKWKKENPKEYEKYQFK